MCSPLCSLKFNSTAAAACPQFYTGALARYTVSAMAGAWLGAGDRAGLNIAAENLLVRLLVLAISRSAKT